MTEEEKQQLVEEVQTLEEQLQREQENGDDKSGCVMHLQREMKELRTQMETRNQIGKGCSINYCLW